MRLLLRTLGALWLLLTLPVAATGQDELRASVDRATGELVVSIEPLLEDPALRSALHSGLPLRIEVRGELWRDGFFDSQEGDAVWRASVLHDPVRRDYLIEFSGSSPRRVGTLSQAGRILADGFELSLRPGREANYYWLATVQVETLSLSDLEELRRWLRGDVAPVVEGNERAESAVANGVRRMVVRALGLPAFSRRLRTERFEWPPGRR